MRKGLKICGRSTWKKLMNEENEWDHRIYAGDGYEDGYIWYYCCSACLVPL